MRHFIIAVICFLSLNIFAQNKGEKELRRVEDLERLAVLDNDTIALFNKYWSPNLKVNTPANGIADVAMIRKRIKSDKLNYGSFERNIEDIVFNDDIAIVMGSEKLVPKGHADNAGKQLTRRFTNIWKYTDKDGWKLIGRQATIIKIE